MYFIMKNSLTVLHIFLFCFVFSSFGCKKSAINIDEPLTEVLDSIPSEINVLTFRDSSNSDHDMIQMAIDYAKAHNIPNVYIPEGQYSIRAAESLTFLGITIPGNIHLRMDSLTILSAIPNNSSYYAVLRITNVSDVKISGGIIKGERNSHTGTGGEWGMGIDVRGANRVEIKNLTVQDCWGDGVYIGGNLCTDILVDGITSKNNRRQGLSAVNCSGMIIKNSTFANTNGTSPQAGIDLEPNATQKVSDVEIFNCQFTGNKSRGLLMWGIHGKVSDVTVYNCVMTNSNQGIYLGHQVSNISISDVEISNSSIVGIHLFEGVENVSLTDIKITNSLKTGLEFNKVSKINVSGIELNEYEKGFLIDNSSNVTVSSTTMTSSKSIAIGIDAKNSNSIALDSLTVKYGQTGMSFYNIEGLKVLETHLKRMSQKGIYLDDVSSPEIKSSHLDSIGQIPLHITNTHNGEFSGNTLIGNCYASDNVYAIFKVEGNSSGNLFSSNLLQKGIPTNKPKYGMWFGLASNGNQITGNTIDTNVFHISPIFDEGSNTIIN